MTTKNEHSSTYVILQESWRCVEPSCLVPEVNTRIVPVYAALNYPPRPCLPDGWTEIDGRTYCPRHQVDAVVRVHTRMDEGAECGSIGQNSPKAMFEDAFPGKEYRR